ncbi:unnamed protein product [Trichogramma brassicae]|uniref:Reverse transcriptase/retrotransposon-derived protein RNase H-like domain-containing protein n=1 Tax=Trichogramma brassicae TaxID=86971 RepID=A0A6H5IU28_9HYME|nr:unnamed protein product [Trichogramma brassicae]
MKKYEPRARRLRQGRPRRREKSGHRLRPRHRHSSSSSSASSSTCDHQRRVKGSSSESLAQPTIRPATATQVAHRRKGKHHSKEKAASKKTLDDQRLIDAGPGHAERRSGSVVPSTSASRPSFKSWKRFESSFRKMFIGKLGEFKLLQELRNRRQGADESIVTFIVLLQLLPLALDGEAVTPRTELCMIPAHNQVFIEPKIARKLASRLQGRATASESPGSPGGDNDARSPRRASAHQRQDRAHAMESDELFGTMISSSERTSRTSGRWTRRPWKANGVYTKALGCRSTEKPLQPSKLASKALLDRVLGEHDDSEAESLECAGLSEITPEQEAAIRVVVDRMMTAEPGTLGLTRLTEHHIDVQGASPIKHKMRRMSPPMLQVAHDEVKKMLARGRHRNRQRRRGAAHLSSSRKRTQNGFGPTNNNKRSKALKKALTEAPVLARPDFARPFIVQCDASALAIGGVLSQVFDDGEHPIVYVSRVFTSAERNYTTSEKECLALLWTIRKLRPYLEGYKFIAVTIIARFNICAISRTRQAVLPDGPWRCNNGSSR